MAQQTQMSRVMPSYERFIAAFPTLESLAAASPADVIRVWVGMGYNQRAVRLHRAARQIAAAGWPRTAAELVQIEGIGPFTAAIIASFAFGEAAGCVDTNVRRVLGRLAGDEAIDGRQLQLLADAAVAHDAPARWNQALMDYGARVCGMRPKCGECVVSTWCASRARYAAAPRRIAEPRATYRKRPAKKAEPFEGSPRYFRGRIIDVLRALPPGDTIALAALPAAIANGHPEPPLDATTSLVAALERHGLATLRDGLSEAALRSSQIAGGGHMPVEVIKVGPLGPYANNVYILADESTKQAIFVDAPIDSAKAIEAAQGYAVKRCGSYTPRGTRRAAFACSPLPRATTCSSAATPCSPAAPAAPITPPR
jgi:A/G-specific adenine glycosylase